MASRDVLVVQPSLQPPGGGNAVAAWMIQALKDRHRVSTLTWRPIELDAVNEYYGTSIAASDITRCEVPAHLRRAIDALPTASVLLKASLLFRYAKRIKDDYDVIVCGHNETDLGPRCIQYVHYPARLRPRPKVDLRWYHFPVLLRGYYSLAERLAQFAPGEVSRAMTLANSTWTAGLVQQLYGADTPVRVVHPPVMGTPSGQPWAERENGFVCVGRLAPEKELERVIAIVAAVRRLVPDAHLHIIGSRGPASYLARIRRLAEAQGGAVQIHEDVSRTTLFEVIGAHRYGIHGMREEHFGIAPAEAAAGGCIVFVPNGGGQVDIVGPEDRLLYSSDDEALRKIVGVMTDPREQARLRTHLAAQSALFTTERFVATIQDLVSGVSPHIAG